MNYSLPDRPRRVARAALLLSAALAVSLLAACSSVPDAGGPLDFPHGSSARVCLPSFNGRDRSFAVEYYFQNNGKADLQITAAKMVGLRDITQDGPMYDLGATPDFDLWPLPIERADLRRSWDERKPFAAKTLRPKQGYVIGLVASLKIGKTAGHVGRAQLSYQVGEQKWLSMSSTDIRIAGQHC